MSAGGRSPPADAPARDRASDTLVRLLDDDEELRWLGHPHRRRMLLDAARLAIPAYLVFGMGWGFVVFVGGMAVEFFGAAGDSLVVAAVVVTALIVVGVPVAIYALARRGYAHAEYAATDRRLVSFWGLLGRDYSSVDWSAVRDVEVSVGALDSLFDTGTVDVVTAGTGGVAFRYVQNPYDLAAQLEGLRREVRDAN